MGGAAARVAPARRFGLALLLAGLAAVGAQQGLQDEVSILQKAVSFEIAKGGAKVASPARQGALETDRVAAAARAASGQQKAGEKEGGDGKRRITFENGVHSYDHHGARIILHEDSKVARLGSGSWVITIPAGCNSSTLTSLEGHMPTGTREQFKGDPDRGGLCVFVMEGTLSQVEAEISTHDWPSSPIVESDKEWDAIPDNETEEDEEDEADESDEDSMLDLSRKVGRGAWPPWGLDRLDDVSDTSDHKYNPGPGLDGAGVHVYIADTGVRVSHQDFEGRAVPTIESLGYVYKCDPKNLTCAHDKLGHGTHCAGIVGGKTYGVAKKSIIHAVKVLADNGRGCFSYFIEAVDWVLSSGPRPAVLSGSLGARGHVASVESALARAVQGGVTVVVAAGNKNTDACKFTPAGVATAITVGSIAKGDSRSHFSNYGKCVNIFAPGSHIASCSHKSDTGKVSKSGTSMAGPHVAGAAALVLGQDKTRTPADVMSILVFSAVSGAVKDGKQGSPNKLLHVPFPAMKTVPSPAPTPAPTPVPVLAAGNCSFEEGSDGFGGPCRIWYNAQKGDQFDWTRMTGRTPSAGTGPEKAYAGSHYLYIETSGKRFLDEAILTSYPLVFKGPTFLSFRYHMHGRHMGSIKVFVGSTIVWHKTGEQGNMWKLAEIDLSPWVGLSPVISIHGRRGRSFFSDAAIDSLAFTSNVPGTVAPTPAPLAAGPNSTACGFEKGLEGPCSVWSNAGWDDFDWQVGEGPTPSKMTGPDKAFDGKKYLYIEASGRSEDQEAALESAPITLSTATLFNFKYCMHGAVGMGSLRVEINGKILWERDEQEGKDWIEASVDLSAYTGSSPQIEVIAVRGSSFESDIAIDELEFVPKAK